METKDILKHLRKERNLTSQQVAEGCGMHHGVYKKYESGERGVGTPALVKLADFYGVSTDYLLGRSDTAPDPLQQLPVSAQDRAILAAYIALEPVERKQLVEIIGKLADGAELEAPSIKQTTCTSRVASRDGSPPRVEEITQEHYDAIMNAPEADPDL